MSANQPFAGYDTLMQLNMTGGLATSADLAPSIIFIILYVLAAGVYIWRLTRAEDRSLLLIRPGIFVVVRLASLILRAVMSKNTYGIGELVADLVLISIGYLFLISTWIDCWKKHVDAGSPPPHPGWVQRLQRILQLVFIAAVATAIASGATSSNAIDSTSARNQVVALRHASAILALVLIGVGLLALIATHFQFGLDARGTGFLLIPACSLLIVAVYRVAQTFASDPNAVSRSKAAFWVLQILFEFIAFCSYVAISLPELFPRHPDHDEAHKVMSNTEMGQANQHRFGSRQ